MFQKRLADRGCHHRVFWIIERDNHEACVARDISKSAHDCDCPRTFENVVGVEGQLATQEIVERVAVQERTGRNQDQPLIAVGDVEIAVHRVNVLLVVVRLMLASWVRGHCRGRGYRRGIGGAHEEPLAQRRHRRRHDSLGEPFMVDERDVENPQT